MKYFSLHQNDQMRPSWVLVIAEEKPAKKTRSLEIMPAAVSAMLGPRTDGAIRFKERYQKARCEVCRRFDSHEVFDIGFDDEAVIRIKGDFGYTNDRMFLISDKFLQALQAGGVKGFETKPIGLTGWHAFKVTLPVDPRINAVKTSGKECERCGRPDEAWGLYKRESELLLPTETNTFFTERKSQPRPFFDREIFMTEEVVTCLKSAGVSGGCCHRLWSEDESRYVAAWQHGGKDVTPPGTITFLSGPPRKRS